MPDKIVYSFNGCQLTNNEYLLDSLTNGGYVEYELKLGSRLGQGAFGTVHEAMLKEADSIGNTRTGLVIKQGYWETQSRQSRLCKEAALFAEVHGGPAYVTFQDARYYLLCKQLPGKTLYHYLKDKSLTRKQKLKLLDNVYATLEVQLHNQGIFHGDLKPNNIMVQLTDNDHSVINFIDFGYSYRINEPATVIYIDAREKSDW